MKQLAIVGAQTALTGGKAAVLLRCREIGTLYAVSLSPHQMRLLEAASCRCSSGPEACEALANTLGVQIEAVIIDLKANATPEAWLLVARPKGLPWQINVDPIEAIALAIRIDLPLLLGPNAEERRETSADGTELPSAVRAFIETLDTEEL